MSQHDYIIDNQDGASFRADINNALAAIATCNSGATAPTTTYPWQLWMDTSTNTLKQRNAGNTAWVTLLSAIGGAPGGMQIYSTAGSYSFTIPANVTSLKVTVVGGGGGSSGVTYDGSGIIAYGANGAGGGAAIINLTSLTPGNTISVTVGAGGTAGSSVSPGGSGGTGGTSSISSGTQTIATVSATGGGGGAGRTIGFRDGSGSIGVGSGGGINIRGSASRVIGISGDVYFQAGGSFLTPGPFPTATNATAGVAGSFGSGAAGGAAASGTFAGAAGGAGVVIFEW